MKEPPVAEVFASPSFRRALAFLGAVWLVQLAGVGWLVDRLSDQLKSGWDLRASVGELIGDSESEICLRLVDSKLEVMAGDPTLWQSPEQTGLPLDPDSLDPEALDPEALESILPGPISGPPGEGAAGDWFCVARESILDDEMEALMSSAVRVAEPGPAMRPIWIFAGLWSLVSLALAVFGAFSLARGPVALVRDLGRARRQIEEGDQSTRLRRRDRGGDMDAVATGINAILDRLDAMITSLSEVSDNIAHDLRTPLTRLQGQLDLVRRSDAPKPEMIDGVQEEAAQLLATFNALLRIAQVRSGSRRKGFRVFDLAPVVTDAGDFYAPAMAENGLSFECRVPQRPVEVHGDADLWMQAVSNLLDNALKYTPSGGHVELSLRPGPVGMGVAAEIELADSGPGIPENEMEKVLERFYRLQMHRRQPGSGLGLSLVSAICQLHGARFELANRDGLTVRITFSSRGLGRSAAG